MNQERRKQINAIVSKMYDLQSEIESILSDEQEYLDNMPENLQDSPRAEAAQEAISSLENAQSNCDDVISSLEEAISN
jgi:hypothetical protein